MVAIGSGGVPPNSSSFEWTRYSRGAFELENGSNVIEFAAREDGTLLDKIYISKGENSPSGKGNPAMNACSGGEDTTPTAAESYTSYTLEAECAVLERRCPSSLILTHLEASISLFQTTEGTLRTRYPADPEYRSTFTLTDMEAGAYRMWARVKASSVSDDSYFVRINGEDWFMWDMVDAEPYEWKPYKAGEFQLQAGTNVIEFAAREDGTWLDKIHIDKDNVAPIGKGGAVSNSCSDVISAESTFKFEAECAILGRHLSVVQNSTASGNRYIELPNGADFDRSPPDDRNDRATFILKNTEAGAYQMWARVRAPTSSDDSFYVRINGSDWFTWPVPRTNVLAWKRYPARRGGIILKEGANIIEFSGC